MAQVYDYIVIGSDIGSLALACALSQNTKNVALVDSQDFAGNDCRAVSFPTGVISNGLHCTPDTELTKKAISFLEDLTGEKILGPSREIPPITFEQGQMREFLGFGDNTPGFYEEIKFFTSPQVRELLIPSQQWAALLIQKFKGEFLARSYVTKFEVADNKLVSITINGSKTVKALNYIYCGPIKALARLMPEDALSQRARTRLVKNTYWSALYLDLCHSKPVTDTSAIHILNGTTADELGPCAGQFQTPVMGNDQTMQVSQWVTFIEDDVEEESEVIGQSLKKMKRQMKRAYPEALEGLKVERIRWAPMVSGQGELKLSGQQTLGEIENLWIGAGAANTQKFWVGSLLQAQLVLAAMGFQSAPEVEAHPLEPASSENDRQI
jgi:hypothetical protein